jgi:hypothetical protein
LPRKHKAPPCDLQFPILQVANKIQLTVGSNSKPISLFISDRNILGRFSLPNSLGDLPSNSFATISSIFNRKAVRQHSPFGGALLNPEDLALDLNRKGPDLIGDSFKVNGQHHARTNWRTNRRKHKRTVLADVSTAALSVLELPITVRPQKCNGCLQQKPEGLSGRAFKTQPSPPRNELDAQ